MGVLAPGSAHVRLSSQPPIDVSGNFPVSLFIKFPHFPVKIGFFGGGGRGGIRIIFLIGKRQIMVNWAPGKKLKKAEVAYWGQDAASYQEKRKKNNLITVFWVLCLARVWIREKWLVLVLVKHKIKLLILTISRRLPIKTYVTRHSWDWSFKLPANFQYFLQWSCLLLRFVKLHVAANLPRSWNN
jgi:hypothetical protein